VNLSGHEGSLYRRPARAAQQTWARRTSRWLPGTWPPSRPSPRGKMNS